jgi:hypothetical protein
VHGPSLAAWPMGRTYPNSACTSALACRAAALQAQPLLWHHLIPLRESPVSDLVGFFGDGIITKEWFLHRHGWPSLPAEHRSPLPRCPHHHQRAVQRPGMAPVRRSSTVSPDCQNCSHAVGVTELLAEFQGALCLFHCLLEMALIVVDISDQQLLPVDVVKRHTSVSRSRWSLRVPQPLSPRQHLPTHHPGSAVWRW